MGAVAETIGVGVVDEGALEDVLDFVAKGVMDDTVSVGGGRNHPTFGIVDFEGGIVTGFVGFGDEGLLKGEQLGF